MDLKIKILTVVSIWYVFWFVCVAIFKALGLRPPRLEIFGIDLYGATIYTFMPSFIFILWVHILKY